MGLGDAGKVCGRIQTQAVLVGALMLAAVTFGTPAPAAARVVVGFGFGLPLLLAPPAYYPPPVYYPPPAYYYPPPAGYAAPPVSGAPGEGGPACREYETTTRIAGRNQRVVGTACQQPDGSWRIVN
ncbi:MAG: hypothetical protein GC191_19140 [Azospirillum sp.]|nr:hypothetical protein [Azospirillum sp.]